MEQMASIVLPRRSEGTRLGLTDVPASEARPLALCHGPTQLRTGLYLARNPSHSVTRDLHLLPGLLLPDATQASWPMGQGPLRRASCWTQLPSPGDRRPLHIGTRASWPTVLIRPLLCSSQHTPSPSTAPRSPPLALPRVCIGVSAWEQLLTAHSAAGPMQPPLQGKSLLQEGTVEWGFRHGSSCFPALRGNPLWGRVRGRQG